MISFYENIQKYQKIKIITMLQYLTQLLCKNQCRKKETFFTVENKISEKYKNFNARVSISSKVTVYSIDSILEIITVYSQVQKSHDWHKNEGSMARLYVTQTMSIFISAQINTLNSYFHWVLSPDSYPIDQQRHLQSEHIFKNRRYFKISQYINHTVKSQQKWIAFLAFS